MFSTKNNGNQPLKIIIGAGEQSYDGWVATHKEQLNLLVENDWVQAFETRKADAFLCEHVWEHLTLEEGKRAAKFIFHSLNPGGYIRVAVPDINFPNEEYQNTVRIGGPGPLDHPAADHKIVFDYRTLSGVFEEAGFQVDLLEYCDESGRFHYNQWHLSKGVIYRSLMVDHRNKNGTIGFASLIIDAIKPLS